MRKKLNHNCFPQNLNSACCVHFPQMKIIMPHILDFCCIQMFHLAEYFLASFSVDEILSAFSNVNILIDKVWAAIGRFTTTCKFDHSYKIKQEFHAIAVSVLRYGFTSWSLTKRLEKRLDGNHTRVPRAVLNKSREQHPTKYQLYGHSPPILWTIQARRTRHTGYCWWNKDKATRNVFYGLLQMDILMLIFLLLKVGWLVLRRINPLWVI